MKRERLQLEDYYFFEYLKASIADLITLLSSSVQNSEGGGDGNGGNSCADPCQEFKQGFFFGGGAGGFLVVSPLFNHFLGYV
jgi:hypothetical protein